MLELRRAPSRLDLGVPRARTAEPLLPPRAGRTAPPQEQLPAPQPARRRLGEATAVGLDGHDVPAALPLQVVEVVGGKPGGHRVADVDVRAIRVRDRHPDQGAGVLGAPGGVRRGQHAGPRRFGHRDVGPVVERLLLRVRVDHPGRGVQPVRPWEQGKVDLQHQVTGPLPLPQPQHVTVRTGNHCGVHRPARQRRVAGRAEVPLDAPGEPGIGQPEVREMQHRIAEQQLTPTGVVVQRPDPAAERR